MNWMLLFTVFTSRWNKQQVNFSQFIFFVALAVFAASVTNGQPILIKDINVGSANSDPKGLIHFKGQLYFSASSPDFGSELWKSDGTEEGTVMVKDVLPGPMSSYPTLPVIYKNEMYFTAADSTIPIDTPPYFEVRGSTKSSVLWKSDGTEPGTQRVKKLPFEYYYFGKQQPKRMAVFRDTLYFSSRNDLWKTDGSPAGTKFFYHAVGDPKDLEYFTVVNDRLYFTITNYPGESGGAYVSDGHKVWGIAGIGFPSNVYAGCIFRQFHVHDNTLFMSATAWWETTAHYFSSYGPQGRKQLGSGGKNMVSWKGMVYSLDNDSYPLNGGTVFRGRLIMTDGTTEGTGVIKEFTNVWEPAGWMKMHSLIAVKDWLYFVVANESARISQLWKSDGTVEGTVLVKTFGERTDPPPYPYSPISSLYNFNDTLFFTGYDREYGEELWICTGDEFGTYRITDIAQGTASSSPMIFTDYRDHLIFSATNNDQGRELYKLKPSTVIEVSDAKTIHIFPNPAGSSLKLNFNQPFDSPLPVEIYNSHGSLSAVYWAAQETEVTLDISDLSSGLYFVKVQGEIFKLVKR